MLVNSDLKVFGLTKSIELTTSRAKFCLVLPATGPAMMLTQHHKHPANKQCFTFHDFFGSHNWEQNCGLHLGIYSTYCFDIHGREVFCHNFT